MHFRGALEGNIKLNKNCADGTQITEVRGIWRFLRLLGLLEKHDQNLQTNT